MSKRRRKRNTRGRGIGEGRGWKSNKRVRSNTGRSMRNKRWGDGRGREAFTMVSKYKCQSGDERASGAGVFQR